MHNLEDIEKTSGSEEQLSSSYQILDFTEATGKSAGQVREAVANRNYTLLWTYALNCVLGLWLLANPHLFDYRSQSLALSDTVSGALVITFEMVAFAPRFAAARWGTAMVGLWLLFAPLIFWSPTPAAYLVDTLVASMLIVTSILIPGTPGFGGISITGPDQPPNWTYNPSSWIRRWAGIALALGGFFISRYLAAHQLGYISHAWDPFFGDGTDKVTGSSLSLIHI